MHELCILVRSTSIQDPQALLSESLITDQLSLPYLTLSHYLTTKRLSALLFYTLNNRLPLNSDKPTTSYLMNSRPDQTNAVLMTPPDMAHSGLR